MIDPFLVLRPPYNIGNVAAIKQAKGDILGETAMNVQPQEKKRITPEAYLELERTSEIKHEYFAGEIFAMTGQV